MGVSGDYDRCECFITILLNMNFSHNAMDLSTSMPVLVSTPALSYLPVSPM